MIAGDGDGFGCGDGYVHVPVNGFAFGIVDGIVYVNVDGDEDGLSAGCSSGLLPAALL